MKGNFHVQFRSSRRESNLSSDCDYSSQDQAFAERLHADLQSKGVHCWFAPEDMKIGDKIRPRMKNPFVCMTSCSLYFQNIQL